MTQPAWWKSADGAAESATPPNDLTVFIDVVKYRVFDRAQVRLSKPGGACGGFCHH